MRALRLVLLTVCLIMAHRGAMAESKIDALVFEQLSALGIDASEPCSDAVFLRRAYLDVTGRIPTSKQAHVFLKSKKSNKRALLIDELLDSPSYADYWAMKWCDILRVKSELPSKLWPNGVQAYYRYIHDSMKNNKPYDQFARELLVSSGSNFRVPEVNFYRAVAEKKPESLAATVAQTFMGARINSWSEDQRNGMAAFFGKVGFKGTSEWKEEIVYFDQAATFLNPTTKKPRTPTFYDGKVATIAADQDPREVFADWLINPENPWFAMNIVNRSWFWLLGRGLMHEPDDIRPDNPPQNEKLLIYLEKELVNSEYDLKYILRLILNSRTYQLSSVPTKNNKSDLVNFSHYYVRQLEAEVLIDAICGLTGTRETYTSRVPEPFTFIPPSNPSITLADGSISSPFLEIFGRPPRDTGLESERSNTPSPGQRLHMLNSTHIHNKIKNSWKLKSLMKGTKKHDQLVRKVYIAALSRQPSSDEMKIARDYMSTKGLSRRDALIDLVWALMNTKEFFCRH
jgi:hypothetical protein